MHAIINTKLIMEDGIIWDGVLIYKSGKIVDAGWADTIAIPDDAEILDAGGLYTAPGLIDIHCHGNGDAWFHEDPLGCAEYLIQHGITTVLPTFYHSISQDEMITGAQRIREASKTGIGRIMDGLYMEGPFMALRGSMQSMLQWDEIITPEQYRPLVEAFGDMVRIWAIDPQRPNVESFMQYVKEQTPHAIFAHGHSWSTSEEIRIISHYGVKVRTHISDAGGPAGRAQGTPGSGGDEYCLYEPDMYAELICDRMGIHVSPDLIKLIVRTKGYEKICLISDHCVRLGNYKANTDAGIWQGPDLNYDDIGYLAGSLMTLDQGVRNLMTHTGYGLCHAIRMASLNPAKLLGIDHRVGSLKKGKTANLILIDDAVNVSKVILEGASI